MKKTVFGCSLYGDSAFEVVNRENLTRELYMAGDKGDYWMISYHRDFFLPNWDKCLHNYGILVFGM